MVDQEKENQKLLTAAADINSRAVKLGWIAKADFQRVFIELGVALARVGRPPLLQRQTENERINNSIKEIITKLQIKTPPECLAACASNMSA